jgi:hypothetical protein
MFETCHLRNRVIFSIAALSVAITGGMSYAQNNSQLNIVALAPTLNFYGLPGVIDIPSAEVMPNGQGTITVSSFGGQTRTSASFQFSPRISATFRYIGIEDINIGRWETYRDRSFDFRYQILKEGRIRPAVTVGLQDFAGTGIYAGEYIVATKTIERPFNLPGSVKVTGGFGWGRLGSSGSIGSPFGSDRATFAGGDTGGELSYDSWFRGPMALFTGVEWQVNDRWGLKAEFSSDSYVLETSNGVFERKSRLNFGAEYQATERIRLGAYWMYGSEIGVTAQLQFNPGSPLSPFALPGPRPIIVRPDPNVYPDAYRTDWTTNKEAPAVIYGALEPELSADGIRIETMAVDAIRAELRVSTSTYSNQAILVGRTARAMARIMPPSIETFDIVLVNNGLVTSKVTLRRSDLETVEFNPRASSALLALAVISDAPAKAPDTAVETEGIYPKYVWSLGPFLRTAYFDPDKPVRADVGIAFAGTYRFGPGWVVSGEIRHRLAGNIADSNRLSNSVLPRVRTNALLYAKAAETTLENLYVSKQWKPGDNTYARVSAGYFEQMFGGLSSEFLWKPAASRLGIGLEANYVAQRDFNQQFGFQDYRIATGHASAYFNFGRGYHGQIDIGRYLAGDVGATFTVEREFGNGWKIGGFFTRTNVSAREFGEGSFDKGIFVTIPRSWFTARPTKQSTSETIRPIQRDGGARINVSGRLYQQVRDGHLNDLVADWGRVWE